MYRILISLLLISSASGFDCKRSEHEKVAKFKSICSLESENEKLELITAQGGCEFPENNKVECGYVIYCNKSNIIRRSSIVFRKGANLSDFCLTPEKVNGKKVRVLFDKEEVTSLMECPVRNKIKLSFQIKDKSKNCELKF